jgi:2-hydroxy-6-oxonona-2,4-dienedioate hydrolase
MPAIEVNGGSVVYDLLGDSDAELVVLTPGGRFSKEITGLRPLANALVDGGKRVLLWDRPNCGESDVQFYGQTESHMRAETLVGLMRALEVGPGVIAGGSGGSRDSMLATMLYPEIATKLIVWNIVGGVYGSYVLGAHYLLPSIQALMDKGIEGLVALPEWQERIEQNPKNRERLLSHDAGDLTKLLMRWLNAYVSKPGQTIPGVEDDLFDQINVPALIIRGGKNDVHHPKRTSLEISCLIKENTLIDPPWPEDAWEQAGRDRAAGKVPPGQYNMFNTWVQAAPAMLDFINS